MPKSTSSLRRATADSERGTIMDSHQPGDRKADVKYEHPPLVKSQVSAWTQSVNAAAVVTALFAGTSAQLFSTVTSLSNTGHTMTFLLLSSYAAMILNALATMASIVLVDHLGDIELSGAGIDKTTAQTGVYYNVHSLELLLDYGAGTSFKHIYWQWIIYRLLGTFFLFMQIVVLMWLREGLGMGIPVIAITSLAVVMLAFSAFRR
ncbi:hypothetical protein K438DRAFT_1975836 [Mycena galopus ATCC 62051]|nr:hypothetical protein K438DRAFT_1975836 [Mycena galopus ATCC 62051]